MNTELPQSKYMNALVQASFLNSRKNIISGPEPNQYWSHSGGAETPLYNEQGPFPVQGNVGSLLKQEAINNYASCSLGTPDIVGSPNCVGVFNGDAYTTQNTCGSECQLKYPESYGEKDFGFNQDMPAEQKITNAHQVQAYTNIRGGMAGQMSNLGCNQYIPNLSANPQTGACEMYQNPVYEQVGSWNKLPMYSNLQNVKYTPFNG
jgi:hypothetical protein